MAITKSTDFFEVGKDYPFTVGEICKNFCKIYDENGSVHYLQHTGRLNLYVKEKITCHVDKITEPDSKVMLSLVDRDNYLARRNPVSVNTVIDILKEHGSTWAIEELAELLIKAPESNVVIPCRQWIKELDNRSENIANIYNDCKYLLELSGFLGQCDAYFREIYQGRLTTIIEQLGYYNQAKILIQNQEEKQFIDNLFERLRSSGFVYHPVKQFNIMLSIFLRSPQKDLMEQKINELYDILRLWPLDIWIKEPFNSTLIKVLQFYIDEYIWRPQRMTDSIEVVRSLLQALTIQLLLGQKYEREGFDYCIELSRLCTLSLFINATTKESVLDGALSIMLSDKKQSMKYELQDTERLNIPLIVRSFVKSPISENFIYKYNHNIIFQVSPKGMQLCIDSGNNVKELLPSDLWQNMQVMANKGSIEPLKSGSTIKECHNLWKIVENDIFASKQLVDIPKHKAKHNIGDTVDISFVAPDPKDSNQFLCKIEDETGGRGYIAITGDIVPYKFTAKDNSYFKDDDGNPFIYNAKIIDQTNDGMFRFSLKENIHDFVRDNFTPDEELICRIVGVASNSMGGGFISVSQEGFSVRITGTEEINEKLMDNDVVSARYLYEDNGNFHAVAKVEEIVPLYNSIDTAFRTLMSEIRNQSTDESIEAETTDDNNRLLTQDQLKEIVRMLDRLAAGENDYIHTYNYLGMARVLCRMIDWEDQANYYAEWMKLIVLLYDFAKNDQVDQKQLQELNMTDSNMFDKNSYLNDKFQQLQIIGCIGHEEKNEFLIEVMKQTSDKGQKIASLSLACNMALLNNMQEQYADFHNRIKDVLGLKGYESHLKSYGETETEQREFKTSLVYKAIKKGESLMANSPQCDPRPQEKIILSVIASFLNSYGGKLYIGVNDSGLGVGIDNDLRHIIFNGDTNKYMQTIGDLVATQWGNNIANYVTAHFDDDPEAKKQVLIVEVQPYLGADGVSIDGVWYTRSINSKRSQTKEDFDDFNIRVRLRRLREMNLVPTSANNVTPATSIVIPKHAEEKKANTKIAKVATKIGTSKNRQNDIVDTNYDGTFKDYNYCLHFFDNGTFVKESTCYEERKDAICSLAVYDEESEGYLVLGYKDGNLNKTPLREIMKYKDRSSHYYFYDPNNTLIFATIANNDDALVTLSLENKKNRLVARVDNIKNIHEGNPNNPGAHLFAQNLASITSYECIPADEVDQFSKILNMKDTFSGSPINKDNLDERLKKYHVGEYKTE